VREYLQNRHKPTVASDEDIRQFQRALALAMQVPLSLPGLDEFNEEFDNVLESAEGSNT
jgi:hypothetical protein